MTVRVYDNYGMNFEMKSKNALEIVQALLHGIKRNYVIIDYTHSGENRADYEIYLK